MPVRHSVVVIGAGPIGLGVAIDLTQQDIPVVIVDDNTKSVLVPAPFSMSNAR